ncbi:MAG: arginine--tRNA ligase [Actinomycetales bacterium]|nr:arginine--tRNA ligase [Actinomycetales bacterium]
MTLSARDHSMSFNPFLQDLHLPIPGPVYWAPGRHLLWYDPHGHRSTRRLDPAEVSSWCADRDPSVLWEQWSQLLAGHRFLVEHTSVNPVHPLHAGSLRGTVLGGAITGLLRSAGADVDVRYFVNDQGRQVTYLRRILPEVDWHTIPTGLRPDEAVGILYALANMREAARHTDIARLVGEHPWLRSAVATSAPLPTTVPEDDLGVVKTMVDCAAQDLHLLGADADSYDYESQLPDDTGALVLELAHRFATVAVNGTRCLNRTDGLVPLQRPDGTSLYFTRDVANTRARLYTGRRLLHVIGDDQVLLQRALRDTVPEADLEHIAFGVVTHQGRKFSARQHRLLTIPDIQHHQGPAGVWALALAILLRRRTVPIELTVLDTAHPLDIVLTARTTAQSALERLPTLQPTDPAWWPLVQAMLQAPGILQRALRSRTPHASAGLLVELSVRYLRAARHHDLPQWLRTWFLGTQSRLAAVHGLRPDAHLDLSPDLTRSNRRTA